MSIISGDCREVLAFLAADGAAYDACVTDPPYELGFMGKGWDNTRVSFQPETWRAVSDVLKPGAHLIAFGGTRTYHRMACAIEDAGFEIRDCVMWIYGSGFPKSLDVSKAIDKAAGAERALTRPGKVTRDGYGDDLDTGSSNSRPRFDEPSTDEARQWAGWGTALKPAYEPIIVARKPPLGTTVAANVVAFGTGGLNIDACRVAGVMDGSWGARKDSSIGYGGTEPNGFRTQQHAAGRWPANVIHDGSNEVLAEFAKFGESKSIAGGHRGKSQIWGGAHAEQMRNGHNDAGTAARFFYSAKASAKDRAGSKHPTVKPISLMRYLCRLVTPPGGTVLDPFAGSGTTLQAAIEEGFRAVGIEREAEYVRDIERRLADARALVPGGLPICA